MAKLLYTNRRANLVLPALALSLAFQTLSAPLWAQDKSASSAPNGLFAPAAIKSEIAYLASDELRGRGSGEPGNERAAQFVAQAFQKAGLKPLGTNKLHDPNARLNGSGFYQPFTFVAGRVFGKNNSLVLRYDKSAASAKITAPNGQAVANSYERVGVIYSAHIQPSSVSGSGRAEGNIVFVGYGIHAPKANHNDYDGMEMKNRIVLMLAGSPKDDPHSPLADYADVYRKAIAARDLGAAAVLIVLPKDADAFASTRAASNDVSDAGIPVLRLRRSAADALLKSAGKSLDTLQADANDNKPVSFAFPAEQIAQIQTDVKKVEKVTANVIGMIEGSDPVLKHEYVVIGAHMDHLGMGGPGSLAKSSAPAVHHGADDNASGTAGVMEIASFFATLVSGNPRQNISSKPVTGTNGVFTEQLEPHFFQSNIAQSMPRYRSRRSIIFMTFSGEELGLFGSDWYVKHPIVPLEKTVAMLNMDMVGRLRDNKLTVIGSGTATEWNDLLEQANKTAGFALAKSESGFGASDQQSFYTKNVPVLFFFTGTHPQYHTPEDTVDLINAEGEARVLSLVADCARRIADAPSSPHFQRMKEADQSAPARALPVYFGSVPDYAAQVEGVQLNGVREGSPAERAGLKAGDIITKFGDRIIKNVFDYTYALQDHKPGEMVQVTVKRGEQVLLLTVTLAAPRG